MDDDLEPITKEWLESIGFVQHAHERYLILKCDIHEGTIHGDDDFTSFDLLVNHDINWWFIAGEGMAKPCDHNSLHVDDAVELPGIRNHGEARNLLKALRVKVPA